jgi:periplasmic protein TonB
MFEGMQAVGSNNRTWTVMLSATMQTAAVGSAVLLSILQSQSIDLRGLIHPPPLVAPYRPPAVQVVAVEHAGASSHAVATPQAPKVFTAPPRIPNRIARIIDPEPAGIVVDPGPPGFISSDNAAPLARFISGIGTASTGMVPPPPVVKAPVKAPPREPLRIGGNVLEARIIHKVIPVYPSVARAMRVSGIVHLIGVIGKDGTVQHLQFVDGHPLLTEAALDAVRQWIYRPTLLNGDPVEVVAPIEVKFLLN